MLEQLASSGIICYINVFILIKNILNDLHFNFRRIRGVAGGITGTSAHIIVSILTQSYLFIEKLITVKNVFFTYAIISFLCIVYIYKNLPETENKSLQEIEEYFKNKNKNRNRNNLPIN